MDDLKDIFTEKVQSKTGKRVYIQGLNNKLNCIVEGKKKSKMVIFIYNDSQEKKWIFNETIIRNNVNDIIFSYDFICIFVCKDESDLQEYHIIEFKELIKMKEIEFKNYLNNKEKIYYFEDFEDTYLDNWNIFDNLDG